VKETFNTLGGFIHSTLPEVSRRGVASLIFVTSLSATYLRATLLKFVNFLLYLKLHINVCLLLEARVAWCHPKLVTSQYESL